MRLFSRLSGVAVILAVVSVCAQTGSAQAVPSTATQHRFWMVVTGGESFTDAVRQAVQTQGSSRVITTLEGMERQEAAGKVVDVPMGTESGVTMERATDSELRAALATARQASTRNKSAVAPALSKPQKFDVVGEGCHPYVYKRVSYFSAWCQLKLFLDFDVCVSTCEPYDVITARVTVDPGSEGSRATFTELYSPDSNDFTDIHFKWWTLCYVNAQTCADGRTRDYSGSKSSEFSPNSDGIDLHGEQMTIAVALGALLIVNGQEYAEGGKTGVAGCLPASSDSNLCLYDKPASTPLRPSIGYAN